MRLHVLGHLELLLKAGGTELDRKLTEGETLGELQKGEELVGVVLWE